jgi:hypothetical protein
MCGTIGTARQASSGGHARHAATADRATPDGTARLPAGAVLIPPLADPQGNDVNGCWPLRSYLELGAVPCARLHTRQLLWEWGLTALSQTAELLVSKIVTNAVQITQAGTRTAPVRLWLLADWARLLILVWDASPLPPVRVSPDGDAENGRGLLLVDTLSTRWDTSGTAAAEKWSGRCATRPVPLPNQVPTGRRRNVPARPGTVSGASVSPVSDGRHPSVRSKTARRSCTSRAPGPGVRKPGVRPFEGALLLFRAFFDLAGYTRGARQVDARYTSGRSCRDSPKMSVQAEVLVGRTTFFPPIRAAKVVGFSSRAPLCCVNDTATAVHKFHSLLAIQKTTGSTRSTPASTAYPSRW